jgi:hypothetical protein
MNSDRRERDRGKEGNQECGWCAHCIGMNMVILN